MVALHDKLIKSEDDLSVTMRLVRQASLEMSIQHPYRMYLDMIIEKCRAAGYDQHRVGGGEPNVKTYEDLVALHFKVKNFSISFFSNQILLVHIRSQSGQ